MPKGKRGRIDEKKLTKGQLRKLNALRKSLGDTIAERAFAEWYASHSAGNGGAEDRHAKTIADAVWQLVQTKKLRLTRKGYTVKRGRKRVIVEAIAAK
jgi:hypothetical protein